jgi:hypothetical protein
MTGGDQLPNVREIPRCASLDEDIQPAELKCSFGSGKIELTCPTESPLRWISRDRPFLPAVAGAWVANDRVAITLPEPRKDQFCYGGWR